MDKIVQNTLIQNVIQTRQEFLRRLLDPRRDLDKECGHPWEITREDYRIAFERGDIAARVVKLYPEESWATDPEVYETEDPEKTPFEKAWEDLQKKHHLYGILQRADVLSGIGRFGVILLGLNDGKALTEPVGEFDAQGKLLNTLAGMELLYLRTFDESNVIITQLENNTASPRFGMPLTYDIQFAENVLGATSQASSVNSTRTLTVHWSRIIHLADNRTNSDIWGEPRMKVVFNRLLDLKKITGGSGEMFWKGGFPGYSLEATPDVDGAAVEFDAKATREEMENYMDGLQRYIAMVGINVKSLAPQVADPTNHVETQIRMIAIAMSVPWRILMGVEIGKLAGEQDMRVWNRRLGRRRAQYITPFVIIPFVQRLIDYGILPTPPLGFDVDWEDLGSPSDLDKATVADRMSNAVTKYIQSGGDMMIPPFHFLTEICGINHNTASAVIAAAEAQLKELEAPNASLPLHPHGLTAPGQTPQEGAPATPTRPGGISPGSIPRSKNLLGV